MPINPNIILQGSRMPDYAGRILDIRNQRAQNERQNELFELQRQQFQNQQTVFDQQQADRTRTLREGEDKIIAERAATLLPVLDQAMQTGDQTAVRDTIARFTRESVGRGVEPVDTMEIGGLINAGELGRARDLLATAVQHGINRGYISAPNPGSTLISGSAAEALGFEPGSVVERTGEGGFEMLQTPDRGPLSTVTINSSDIGKTVLDRLADKEESARLAVNSLSAVYRARQLVEQGIISGTGAELRLSIARALGFAGLSESEAASRTEEFLATLAVPTAQIIQNFGAGTGLSDADRQFAARAAGGDIELTDAGIKRILRISEHAFNHAINSFNLDLDARSRAFPEISGAFDRIQAPEQQQIIFGDALPEDEGATATNAEGVQVRAINGKWVRIN